MVSYLVFKFFLKKKKRDLCDVKKQGALTKHYFGVAMHLVGYKKRNQNFQLPSTLPTTLLDPDSKTPTGSFNMGSGTGSFGGGMLQPQPIQPINGLSKTTNSMPMNNGMNNMSGGMGGGIGPISPRGMNNMMNNMSNGPIQTTTKVNSLLKETNGLKDDYFQMQQQVSQAQMNLEQNKQQEQQLMNEIQSLKPQIEELRITKQKYQQEQARIESKLLMLREDNQANKELSLQLKTEVERLELLKKNGEETVLSLTKNLEDVGETIKSDTNLLEEKQSEILKLKTEYDSLVQKMNEFQGTVNQTQLDNITQQVKQQHIQNEELSTKLASLESKNEQMTSKYETNKKIHQEYTLKIEKLKEKIVQIEKEIEEKSKIPNLKPKLVRLDQFHDTAVKYLKEMENILLGLKSDNSSTISPLNEDLFSKPIETKRTSNSNKNNSGTNSPSSIKKQVTTPADHGFGFDDDFGEKESSFDSFEQTSGFGKDFSIQNNNSKATPSTPNQKVEKKVESDPGPQMPNFKKKETTQQEPTTTTTTTTTTTNNTGSIGAGGFDDFDGFGKSSGFDDFDGFGNDNAVAKVENVPTKTASFDDFDGFGNDTKVEEIQTSASFDNFDGFGTDEKKIEIPTNNTTTGGGGFDDFGFDDFGTSDGTKKDDGFGNDAFDGFGDEKKPETTNTTTGGTGGGEGWDFGSDPW